MAKPPKKKKPAQSDMCGLKILTGIRVIQLLVNGVNL